MKTKLLLLLLAFASFVNAQNATFSNGFEAVALPTGWSSNGLTRTTVQPCSGIASMTATTGQYAGVQLVSPNYLSDGQAIRLSVNYKLDFNGIIYLNYNINDGAWIGVANTSTSATNCTVLSGVIASNVVPAGSNVRFQISTYNPTILNVTYKFDDFQAVQADSNTPLSEYDFDNTRTNILGTAPFSTANTTFTTNRNNVANSALSIASGATGTSATVTGLPLGNASRTVSFWYKLAENVNNSAIFYYGAAGANTRFGMFIQDTGRPVFWANLTNPVFGTGSFAANTWHHVVLSHDGTNIKIYMNGVLQDTKPFALATTSTALNFANSSTTLNLDDLKIYNIALTDAQVLNLFNNNAAVVVAAPVVSNVSTSNNTPVGTTINYAVNANNATTTTTIKYGLSAASLTNQVAGLIASGNNLIPVTKMISNLESNTQYFYQVEVTNASGTTQSAVMSFTTLVAPTPVAEYDFNNTFNNLAGTTPFSTTDVTSFVTGRDGSTLNGALKMNSTGVTSATITGLPYGASPRTISFWAKTDFMFAVPNTTFSYGATGIGNGQSGSFIGSQLTYSANNNEVNAQITTQGAVWYYYTYIYDGINAKIYRDGTLITSEAKAWNTINNNDIFRLGATVGNQGGFIGSFDDLKIYDYAISDNQINNLYLFNSLTLPTATAPVISDISSVPLINTANVTYNINANYAPTTTVIKYGTTTTSLTSQIAGFSTSGNSLTATSIISNLLPTTQYYYQIEATNSMGTTISPIESFTTVANLPTVAAYSFNNTLNNMVGSAPFSTNTSLSYVADRNATASSALRIFGTGTSTTIANLPTGTAPRTVSIWYKLSTASNDNCLFVYGQSGGQNAYGVSFNNANAWFNFAWSTNTPFTNPTNDGAWHHLVTTFDASKTSKVYVDGVLKSTLIQNGWNTSVNNNTFWLAGLFSPSASTFDGTVDDLMIYDFALTSDQVLNLFNSPTLSSQDFNQNTLVVALYPNPASDVLNIEMINEIQSIEIYNVQGQKVLHATQKQINVSNLATGMYLIKIQDHENGIATKKFMKK